MQFPSSKLKIRVRKMCFGRNAWYLDSSYFRKPMNKNHSFSTYAKFLKNYYFLSPDTRG